MGGGGDGVKIVDFEMTIMVGPKDYSRTAHNNFVQNLKILVSHHFNGLLSLYTYCSLFNDKYKSWLRNRYVITGMGVYRGHRELLDGRLSGQLVSN